MERLVLWMIMLQISNDKKIKLVLKYKELDFIKENFYYIEELKDIETVKEKDIIEFEEYIMDNNIRYITIFDKEYPKELYEDMIPPFVLFFKGNIELLNKRRLAIVGARNCSQYGIEVTKLIAREISNANICIVSGMALGIDTIAHKESLKYSGSTIAVLGSGIDVIYPKSNKNLYYEIIEKGLVLSEFLPKETPKPYNFPRRNRIISGISEGIIVSEASCKSGTLITVECALNQNRKVMVVPGSILNKKSEGCNKLIRDGAESLTDLEDLKIYFNIKNNQKNETKINFLKNSLFKVISDEPKHLDDILSSVNVDRKVLFELLFEMQNRNEIICLPGNYYAKSI